MCAIFVLDRIIPGTEVCVKDARTNVVLCALAIDALHLMEKNDVKIVLFIPMSTFVLNVPKEPVLHNDV